MFGTFEAVVAALSEDSTKTGETDDNYRALTEPDEMITDICSALWGVASESTAPIQIMPDLYDKTGRIPISTIEDHFEDFATAARMAGLETESRTDVPTMWYPPLGIDLVNELERVGDIVGGRPTVDDMNAKGQTSVTTYILRFGSWEEACDAILSSSESSTTVDINNETDGTHPTRMDKMYSRAELLDAVRSLADDLGRLPTTDDLKQHGKVSASPIYDRFGSWQNALREAGLLPSETSINLHTPIEEFAEEIDSLGPRGIMELQKAGYKTVRDVR